MPGLPSDIIACAVKLMSNDELIAVGRKVFNPLPGIERRRQGLHGRAHPAELADRRSRGHRLAGARRLVPTPSATSCSAPIRCRATSIRWRRSRWRCATCWRPSASRTCCRIACWRTSTCRPRSRQTVPGIDRAVVPEPRRRRRRQRGVRHRRRARCAPTRRRAPGATGCTSRRARAPTRPTATARASTW